MESKILPTSTGASTPTHNDFNRQSRKRLLGATVATLALMFIPYADWVLYPLRLFITFIHESGHALTTLAVSGNVVSLHVHPDGSGVTPIQVAPLWAWLPLSGGYLGTMVFGAIMLQVGRLRKVQNPGRASLYLAAIAVGLITALWGWHDPFTLTIGITMAAGLALMARKLTPKVGEFFATFLAVQCSLNAIGDIRILLALASMGSKENDAGLMAQAYGGSSVLWASLWGLIAIITLFFSLRSYLRATAKRGGATA